jgi:large subunit ribosomal protein L29
MTGAEVRVMTDEQIRTELSKQRGRLLALRTQRVTEKVEDNSQFGKVRRDIARLLTEQHRRKGP